jgi:hypothetical protein
MKRIVCIVLGITLCGVLAAVAQTAQERAACRGDVFRLCTAAQIALATVGDRGGVYACFAAHRRELSRGCDRVLKSHGY